MSKAAELAALIGSQTALSNRNLIINGAMQVAQRGDVTGKTSSSYGGPDRFRLGISGAGTHSISQSTTVPSGSGFSNSWKLDCTVADTTPTLMAAQYRFEGHDLQQLKKGTSSAQSVTVSFWVRSNVTGTYVLEWRDRDNTRHIAKTYTISAANTFEYKTLTFAGDTSGTIDNDNGHSMELSWWLASSSTYTSGTLPSSWAAETNANRAAGLNVNIAGDTANEWLITGVQLEVGEQATPFEHRSFGDELERCRRYYNQWSDGDKSYHSLGIGTMYTNTYMQGGFELGTEMRAVPSLIQENSTDSYGVSVHGAFPKFATFSGMDGGTTEKVVMLYRTGSISSTQGASGIIYAIDSTLALDAEL